MKLRLFAMAHAYYRPGSACTLRPRPPAHSFGQALPVHFAPPPTQASPCPKGNTPRRAPGGYQAELGLKRKLYLTEASPRNRAALPPVDPAHDPQPFGLYTSAPARLQAHPHSRRLCTSLWLASPKYLKKTKMDEEILI